MDKFIQITDNQQFGGASNENFDFSDIVSKLFSNIWKGYL